jgi:hypothetical protein
MGGACEMYGENENSWRIMVGKTEKTQGQVDLQY